MFCKKQRKCVLWTPAEDEIIRQLRFKGKSVKEISRQVKRSAHAVNDRLTKRLKVIRCKKKIMKHQPDVEPPPLDYVEILKFQLPTYYEAGWRVASFTETTIFMEREQRNVIPPHQVQAVHI